MHGYIGVGAHFSFPSLLIGLKKKCKCRSKRSTKTLKVAMCSVDAILTRIQQASREREDTLHQFAIQRPLDILHMPHLTTHSVLKPELGTTTNLTGWDFCTKDDAGLLKPLFNNFCMGAPQQEWKKQYSGGGYEVFSEWDFSYNYQSEVNKQAGSLKRSSFTVTLY